MAAVDGSFSPENPPTVSRRCSRIVRQQTWLLPLRRRRFGLEAHSDRSTLGGMEFDNFYIQYNRDVPFMQISAPSKEGSFKVKDIKGTFTIKNPGDNPLDYKGGYQTDKNVNVSINYKYI